MDLLKRPFSPMLTMLALVSETFSGVFLHSKLIDDSWFLGFLGIRQNEAPSSKG